MSSILIDGLTSTIYIFCEVNMLKRHINNLLSKCPVCSGPLLVSRIQCGRCDTQIDSLMAIPTLLRLPDDLQEFVLIFLRCRGNIREVEKTLGISYPTVCKRLDMVNHILGNLAPQMDRKAILEQLERGEITAKQAADLLKGGIPHDAAHPHHD